ncbi:hypothetical protein IWW34DRAFT_684417 [Fusarium oxysporum f. sp. albedinis]|nr:hypothetical protein IWW34DRAFT_684417 [Fusarium oxysporum f. sp. albedinis]
MATEEATFRNYTQAQGESYATGCPGYSPELFEIILNHHTSTGGRRDTVLEVGCGTGQATRDLAPFFKNAIGIDPSEGMITSARETINAARVVKAGGTVALWARTGMSVDPAKTLNGAAIKAAVEEILNSELHQYYKQGNTLTRDLYVDLPLPWTIKTPVTGFDKSCFIRKEWSHNTETSETEALGTGKTLTPEEFEKLMGTSSPVARWREANPDKAGTEEDVARKVRRRIESLLHEVGVEPGEELLRGRTELVLLMVKKKGEERT